MPAVSDSRATPSIFEQLLAKDRELTDTFATLREACAELAAKNGEGEPIRQLIRSAFIQTRGKVRGASR